MQSLLKCHRFEVISRPMWAADDAPLQEIVLHPGAVVILPLISDDELVMIRNNRPAVERELWELPAGMLDVPGESLEQAARRELAEEAGVTTGCVEELCRFYPSPGVMSEQITAFVATDLTRGEQDLEPTERIVPEDMKMDTALAMVMDGRIMDAKTIITLLMWERRRKAAS